MPLYRTWAVTLRMNHFLSLTLSHHYPSVTSTLRPHSFPSIMHSGPTLSSAFSHLVYPLLLLSGWSLETANNHPFATARAITVRTMVIFATGQNVSS